MATHPSGITVEIVGIESSNQGRSCEEHDICGSVIAEDVVVRFRKVQVIVEGKEDSAIAAYWVSDGIDRCRVGFLQHDLVKHWKYYDGLLAQVIEVYGKDSESQSKRKQYHTDKGCCVAAIISYLSDDTINQISHHKRRTMSTSSDDSENSQQTKRQKMVDNNNDN